MVSEERYKKVAVLENQFEAQLLSSVLTERGIPHHLRSYHDTAFDGLFQTQKGWGYVSAPESCDEAIGDILAELRKDGSSHEE